ncbi:5-amino-6-(5-phospho-D-ribitylamino)uracil phosphatase YcsE [Methanosarcinaceae archaeon Ag5]|uniref:Phosphoglycolate phosphatase n=1 Tax=Methanolapillus africanus TaxID=3028297 RepID=A0AAE4ML24_9EURY|nr:5-amino-6-(5-phospho-D-ribitylamino)uracil phosphatase YcsE [Methanosarcinaceae archaeon Ag5]
MSDLDDLALQIRSRALPGSFSVIVSDIDGTITEDDRSLSLSAAKVIQEFSDKIPIVLASGNTLCFTRAIAKALRTNAPVIAENGGIVLEEHDGVPVINNSYLPEMREALAVLQEHFDFFVFDSYDRQTDIAFSKTFDIEKARHVISGFSNLSIVDAKYAAHLVGKNINKGTALKQIADMYGITPENIVVIGDSANDIEMFHAAGMSFVVANAPDYVKKEADIVLDEKFGDGFAQAVLALEKAGALKLKL